MAEEWESKKDRQKRQAQEANDNKHKGGAHKQMRGLSTTDTGYTTPEITRQPTSQTVQIGSKLRLSAAAKGVPLPKYRWRHNGTIIEGTSGNVLIIPNCRTSNGGSYSVEAYNIAGSVTSRLAMITVVKNADSSPEMAGEVAIAPSRITVASGQEFAFTATLKDCQDPQATFQWFKDGRRIKGATKNVLRVSRAKEKYVGNYVVVVETEFGIIQSDSAVLELKVVPLPAAGELPALAAPQPDFVSDADAVDALVGAAELLSCPEAEIAAAPALDEIDYNLIAPLETQIPPPMSPRIQALTRKKTALEKLLNLVLLNLAKPMAHVYQIDKPRPAHPKAA